MCTTGSEMLSHLILSVALPFTVLRYKIHSAACAIHKATGYLVTSPSQNAAGRNTPLRLFLLLAPIHSLWDIFQWNGGSMK